jgi:putative ABC transport system substrate-binding protein
VDRRAFIGTLAGGLLATPRASQGQIPKHVPVLGLLGTFPRTVPIARLYWEAFEEGLRVAGWVKGRTVRIVERFTEGRPERFPELAGELVRLKVDVIVASGSQATQAAMGASGTIPIVFISVSHPVEAGFAASLVRPGGHTTGVTNEFSDLHGKVLQLAREVAPNLRHIGIIWNPADPGSTLGFKQAQQSYQPLGVKVTSVPVRSPEDLEGALKVLSRERPDFLLVHPSPTIYGLRERISEYALRVQLPTSTTNRVMAEDGSILMSYGPDFADLFRRAAVYVDKILKGAKPGDLPVEQPTKFDLVINMKTAKALGLTIPPSLLQRADQVIE